MCASSTTHPSTVTKETTQQLLVEERQLVVFCLSNDEFGVDIGSVREIIRLQDITRVPKTPDYIEGLTNLRGRVVPVVDLRKRFGLPAVQNVKNNRIVIVDIADQDIGVIVDAVTEVLRVPSDCIEPPSSIVSAVDSEYFTGIAKLPSRLIILLDLEKALSGKGEFSETSGGS